jgi:methyl-accepting chemotaxis protein
MNGLRDLSVSKKVAIIVVLLSLPSVWLLGKVTLLQHQTILATDLKLQGLQHMRGMWKMSGAIADHRALAAQYMSGKPDDLATTAKKAAEVDAAIATIDQLERTIDGSLRMGDQWKEVSDTWSTLKTKAAASDSSLFYRKHTALLELLDSLMSQVTDRSTLLYDSDSTAHFLTDAVVVQIPQAQAALLALRRAVATGSGEPKVINPARSELATRVGGVRVNAASLRTKIERLTKLKPEAADAIASASKTYIQAAEKYAQTIDTEMVLSDNRTAVLNQAIAEANAAFRTSIELQDRLIPLLEATLQERRSAATWARNGTVLAFVIAMTLVLLLTRTLRHTMHMSAQLVVEAMERMANGEIGQRIRIDSRDEFGRALAAVDRLDTKLAEVIAVIGDTANKVGDAAKELSAGSEDLSDRAQSQAAAIEQTASSMEEMTATVKQNADNAKQAHQLAASMRDQAEQGSQVVKHATDAMNEINSSSAKIADIIGVIDSIAFQTNLLALNAAVEAARAGEQGRGFAVVASEVRNLAQRSAEAAKDIKKLIGDSVDKARTGAQWVNQSGSTLAEIVESARKVSNIIAEIAAASSEQSAGIDQVNHAITRMDALMQETATRVDHASAASKGMQEDSEQLLTQISHFRVQQRREGDRYAAGPPAVTVESREPQHVEQMPYRRSA